MKYFTALLLTLLSIACLPAEGLAPRTATGRGTAFSRIQTSTHSCSRLEALLTPRESERIAGHSQSNRFDKEIFESRRSIVSKVQSAGARMLLAAGLVLGTAGVGFAGMPVQSVMARPEGVNRPDLLPKDQTPVIDVAKFLSKGQEKKITSSIEQLEKTTGFKLRVLCQSYPETPGSAIKDYWKVDDKTIVLVVDRGEGFNRRGIPSNLINLNLGSAVEGVLPNSFWIRLANKLGNQPYVKKNGEDIAVLNTVEAIAYCLEARDCKDLPFNL